MLSNLRRKLKLLCSKIRRFLWRRPRPKVVIRRLGKWYPKRSNNPPKIVSTDAELPEKPIRIATFNVAMFTLAPAISQTDDDDHDHDYQDFTLRPSPMKSVLKSPMSAKSNSRASNNLPEHEITLANNKLLSLMEAEKQGTMSSFRSSISVRSPLVLPSMTPRWWNWCGDEDYDDIGGGGGGAFKSGKSILEVLREIDADVLALQDVKAEEEKAMKPLSELANALGMRYVFAESWAPEFGNAILSKWPIKSWNVQKIANNDDFRNVLKATIEVPWAGEVNVYCTQLDHLNENWRMKQICALSQSNSNESPHILAGGLNSLEASDYSSHRWSDIVKYYEEMGKPTPKIEVMKYLKGKGYTDAKDFAGECEPVVIIAKGQNVQGTCKYGTRVDYVLSSSESPYKFVPGSYTVVSSKGTSDHHLVKVDFVKENKSSSKKKRRLKSIQQKLVRVASSSSCSSRGV